MPPRSQLGRRRLLVVANPGKGSDSDEEQPSRNVPSPVPAASPSPAYYTRPLVSANLPYAPQRPSPRSEVSSSRGDDYRPSPIPAVDRPPYPDRYSSRSESTPPPVTPGQPRPHDPYVNLSVSTSPEDPQSTLMPKGHLRRPSNTSSPRSPAAGSLPPTWSQPSQDKLLIMATTSDTFIVVDITGADNADFIRERMFSKLQISDHDQHRYSIYRTVLGEYPQTAPLHGDELLRVCLQEGDGTGSLKFLVVPYGRGQLPPINTLAPVPVPPAPNDFSPSLVRSKGIVHRPSAPSVSSASGDRGELVYSASESEVDPPDRGGRGMVRQYDPHSPPSASAPNVSNPRPFPSSSSRQHHPHTASSSPISTTRTRHRGGTDPAAWENRPLPQAPPVRRESSEQEQVGLRPPPHLRPGPIRRSSVKKRPHIPPAPTAPPPVPVGSPALRPSPRARGLPSQPVGVNLPLSQSSSRVDKEWFRTGQAPKQMSPPRLKPVKSMDMLSSGFKTGAQLPQRQGDSPASAHPDSQLQLLNSHGPGMMTGGSRLLDYAGGRPVYSDTDRPTRLNARVMVTSPSAESLESSGSTDERLPSSPLSPADNESTLRADQRQTIKQMFSLGPPVLPPISTDKLLADDPKAWPDDEDTIWVHPPPPVFIPPASEEDTIWAKPPSNSPSRQLPQPRVLIVSAQPSLPSASEVSPKQKPKRQSRFVNRESVTWNVRPPAQEVYEHLEDFFPEHDLDKPLLEASGGGDSPATPVSASQASPLRSAAPQGIKHRKTIRNVASERKKYLDRTSKIESQQAAMMRKRSTKLWGTKVEEVAPGSGRNGPPSGVPESPDSSTTKPVTRWIKGDLIGKGTYGKVFLALNANTGEMIAVKQVELPKTASDKADARQTVVVDAIKSESTTLRDLDHPNVVQYLGFEETTDYFNLFLEYVPGGSIGGILRKMGKFEEELAKSFTHQILCGLEYLHSRGVLHRDLKGDNILVDPSGICKISDFGISKRSADVERLDPSATNMTGSIFWMAPEVMSNEGQGYNVKIDIWSLGCVYVEMMTGRRPWENDTFVAVMYKLSTTRESPPIPQLSEIGQRFVSLCFEKDPMNRPGATVLRAHPYLVPKPGWIFNGFI